MLITVTHLRLKTIWKYFSLINHARHILHQARSTNGLIKVKTRGLGLNHYTLTAWESSEAMRAFMRTGAHANSMKASAQIASVIRTYSFEADAFPDWQTAKAELEKGRTTTYP